MTRGRGRIARSVERNATDGLLAMRLVVMVLLLAEFSADVILKVAGVRGLGPDGTLPILQDLLTIVAVGAVLWLRPRLAVVLSAVVVVMVFTVAVTLGDLSLVLCSALIVAARGSAPQIVALAVVQVLFGIGRGVQTEQYSAGDGPVTTLSYLVVTSIGLIGGLLFRYFRRGRDRERERIATLERENVAIRDAERAQLADDLQLVVTGGLDAIEAETARIGGERHDPELVRAGLARVEQHSRGLLTELRALLDVLRRESPAPAVGARRRRSLADLIAARHVRVALAVLLAIATVAVLVDGPTYWLAVPVGLACLLATVQLGLRRLWRVVLALVALAALVALTDRVSPIAHVSTLFYSGVAAILVGLTTRHFLDARRESGTRRSRLLADRDRVEADERGAVARELHDVVAHQLSLTTLLVMAALPSDDPRVLNETADRVREATVAARAELAELLITLRGAEPEPLRPTPLISPVDAAGRLADRLREHGFIALVDVDPEAETLDPTTQRTLARIMQEGTTNMLRHAPPGTLCRCRIRVDRGEVELRLTNPLPTAERSSPLSLGWGLRGIRERVDLTHGTFAAGAESEDWVVVVTLPRAAPLDPAITR